MALLEPVGELEQRVALVAVDRLDDDVDAVDGDDLRVGVGVRAAPPGLALALSLRASSSSARRASASAARAWSVAHASPGGDGLDAARAAADRPLGEDREPADLGRRADVRAAAELGRRPGDVDDAHDVAVLLAEQRHRAEPAGLVERRLERVHREVREHGAVDTLLDRLALLAASAATGA